MACHLEHRLPWESLRDVYIVGRQRDPRVKCCPPKMAKQLNHFAECFVRVLSEFRNTAMPTDSEIQLYDPKVWGEREFTINLSSLGYYDSLFWGYLELNLLLLDGETTDPLMNPPGYLSPAIDVMIGKITRVQPEHLTTHLKPAFADRKLRPLTADTVKILRDHAAMLFRCMYLVSGENKLLDVQRMRSMVFGFFNWSHGHWTTTEDGQREVTAPRCCPWIVAKLLPSP